VSECKKIIIEDPHLVYFGGLGDHQIRTPLRNDKKICHNGKKDP
jgi:hypothetical protein